MSAEHRAKVPFIDTKDPFLVSRAGLQEIKEGSRNMTGEDLFTVLRGMYDVKIRRLYPKTSYPPPL